MDNSIDNNKKEFMLTTIDNPYSPFTQYDDWLSFDLQMGYDSCGLLGRIAMTSNQLSPVDNELEISRAIESIVKLFPGIYTKAYQTDSKYTK